VYACEIGGPAVTDDGIEYTLGITHFGHFALTQLLLPKLLESQRGMGIISHTEHVSTL
jgi:NAD(P)-dependent dehydrogenase (short-subunit alcohol dehydrogenase family)